MIKTLKQKLYLNNEEVPEGLKTMEMIMDPNINDLSEETDQNKFIVAEKIGIPIYSSNPTNLINIENSQHGHNFIQGGEEIFNNFSLKGIKRFLCDFTGISKIRSLLKLNISKSEDGFENLANSHKIKFLKINSVGQHIAIVDKTDRLTIFNLELKSK